MTSSVAQLGDTVELAQYLVNTRVYGVVVPAGQPPQFMATYEIQGDQGTLTMAVMIGPEGPAGTDALVLDLQNDTIDDPANLPQTLTNTSADKGKYWLIDDVDANGEIIGSSAYIWYGTTWRRIMFGSPGPQGLPPIISPSVEIIPATQNSFIETGGTIFEPTMEFNLAIPAGPQGTGSALAAAPDTDFTTNAPVPGDVLGFTGRFSNTTLSPPGSLSASWSSTGGTFAAGQYFWIVTAINANGETTPSNEVSLTLSGSTSSVKLVWLAPGQGNFGPTGYKIYRGTVGGGENKLIATINNGTTTTYTDTGTGGSTATPPSNNTATVSLPLWVPVSVSQLIPGPYSMPEGAFTSFSGISQRAAIGSFAIPPQPYAWTPIIWGHIGAFGLELSANPLMIGCEVRLGDPTTGTLVARGFGNTLGEVNIMPHYSNPSAPSTAITPSNGTAVVPANHSNPAEGTIYVNLYNDGEIGLYIFQPTDAQIAMILLPITG